MIQRAIVAFVFVSSSLFGLNGAMQIGYGVKSKGMGGVGIAYPQEAFVSAMNPAGLAYLTSRADLALHWIQLNQSFTENVEGGEERYSTTEDNWFPEGALNCRFGGCQAFGFAAYSFGAIDTRYDRTIPRFGHEHRTGSEWKMYLFTPSWAWRVTSCLSIGAAVNLAWTWASIKGLEELATPAESVAPQYVTNRGTDHEEGFSIRLGALFCLPCLRLGITYQTRTWLNDFKRYKGFFPDHGNLRMPSQWGVGVAWTPRTGLVASADVLRIHWTDSKAFRHDAHNKGKFGAWDGKGYGWNDQTVVKFGVAWAPYPFLTIRAGWNWSEVPFSGEDVILNALTASVVRRHYTVGATLKRGCHELSFYTVRGEENTTTLEKEESTFSLTASETAAGVSYAYRF